MPTPASPFLKVNEVAYLRHLKAAGDKMADLLLTVFDRVGSGGKDLQIVRFATTANINLATTALTAIDGVTPVAGDLALVKNQTTGSQNGVYVVSAGAWTRLKDDVNADILKPGMLVIIQEGTSLADTAWELATNAPITVGTTALTFNQLVTSVANASITYAKLAGDVHGAPQLIVAAGATAVDVTKRTTHVDGNAATNNVTSSMADGTQDGQRKTLVLGKITSAKTWVVTPANFFNGTTITFSVAGGCAELMWSVSVGKWLLVGGTSYTIA